tara:strand:- start:57777 stop:58643 length:867 start_codon:yes stop_codon:yes gene_type:complete
MMYVASQNLPVNLQYQLIKLAWAQYQSSPENLDAACLATLKQQAKSAQKIIRTVLNSEQAESYSVIPEEVNFVVEQLILQCETLESFQLLLKKQNITQEELQIAIYQDLLCEKIIEAQSNAYIVVTDQEASDYYDKNKHQFMHPERRHVSHILITINDQFEENKKSHALIRINALRISLLDKKELFATKAMSHSECPTALNNGVVGKVSKGQLYPELDKVLFAMQADTMSAVVESEIGFHLLYCHEIYPAFETPKAEALKEITKQLNQHRKSKCEKKWLTSLLVATSV